MTRVTSMPLSAAHHVRRKLGGEACPAGTNGEDCCSGRYQIRGNTLRSAVLQVTSTYQPPATLSRVARPSSFFVLSGQACSLDTRRSSCQGGQVSNASEFKEMRVDATVLIFLIIRCVVSHRTLPVLSTGISSTGPSRRGRPSTGIDPCYLADACRLSPVPRISPHNRGHNHELHRQREFLSPLLFVL